MKPYYLLGSVILSLGMCNFSAAQPGDELFDEMVEGQELAPEYSSPPRPLAQPMRTSYYNRAYWRSDWRPDANRAYDGPCSRAWWFRRYAGQVEMQDKVFIRLDIQDGTTSVPGNQTGFDRCLHHPCEESVSQIQMSAKSTPFQLLPHRIGLPSQITFHSNRITSYATLRTLSGDRGDIVNCCGQRI